MACTPIQQADGTRDYGCRDGPGGCCDDTAAEGFANSVITGTVGAVPVLDITPGMTGAEVQAAVNAYNAQVPTYSGGKSTAWAIAPTAQYNIFGAPVTTGETREETAVRVATGGGSAESANTVIDRGIALITDNLVLITIVLIAMIMIPRLIRR
jgi:hypothetical protein